MARSDEQHPQSGGGSHPQRTDLQLEPEPAEGSVANEDEVTANLPTIEEQIEMIAEAEDEKSSAFAVSQEDIDSVLTMGSSFQDGKYRIYRQFQKNEDSKSNIAFLKNEYGTGGGTHDYPDGTRGGEWHDSKGIGIEKHGSYTNPDLRLSWSKVEKRLRELIKNDRYLNAKEKEHYADFLESIEAPQYEIDTQRKMARQRFIESKRELPPADKRDTLSLRLSDFIRDLDGYEKGLLSEVGRTDFADMTAEEMETELRFFACMYIFVNRNIEHRNKLNKQLDAWVLPFVFDCLNMSGSVTDNARELLSGHSFGFTGFLDCLSYRRKIKVKIVVPFVHKLTTYSENLTLIFYRDVASG